MVQYTENNHGAYLLWLAAPVIIMTKNPGVYTDKDVKITLGLQCS